MNHPQTTVEGKEGYVGMRIYLARDLHLSEKRQKSFAMAGNTGARFGSSPLALENQISWETRSQSKVCECLPLRLYHFLPFDKTIFSLFLVTLPLDWGWEVVESAFRDIVCDELKRIKQSSLSDCLEISTSDADDSLWNYDGPHIASESTLSEGEELMIEMEKALYEDLKAEAIRRVYLHSLDYPTLIIFNSSIYPAELEYIDQTEEEEDDYLAQAVFEQMQLNDDQSSNMNLALLGVILTDVLMDDMDKAPLTLMQVGKDDRIWCPICKRGELRENVYLIYCSSCGLQLDIQTFWKMELRVLLAKSDISWAGNREFKREQQLLLLSGDFGFSAGSIGRSPCGTS
ncbi:RPA-interacting protein isoform X1 [Cinnamomum micranthum f. kanehirae]|uniref:RPA-interacting protein isoform X1 n=1 Tax=Cinnamomum micranthum f. kanehirae TaxID=337451 RepID=A0A3S3Q8P4_9MAGN|nr:RPA-interacting protein isoform X1 [Cinnamomum micranthum f. kanehirae]